MASKSLSSFPVQAAYCAHNSYLRENLCRYSPKITLPIDVGRQDLKEWLQTHKVRQTASSRFELQPGFWARLFSLYCTCIIPYHTIPFPWRWLASYYPEFITMLLSSMVVPTAGFQA